MTRVFLNPYATWPELRASMTASQVSAKWLSYLTKFRADLAKLPVSSVQIVGGLGLVRPVLTSEDMIKAAVADCVPAKGVNLGSAEQIGCWFEAIKKNVAQMSTLFGQMKSLAEQFAGAVYPPTVTEPGLQKLRVLQLQFLDLSRKSIQAVESSLQGWTKILEGLQRTATSMITYQADVQAIEGTAEYDKWNEDKQRDVLQLLNKVYLPMLDVSLYELEVTRDLTDLATQALGRMASLAQFLPEYQSTLKSYIDHLGTSHREGGLFDGILRFLFGAEPGKKIAMIVVGTVVAVALVSGVIYFARRSISKAA